MENVQPGIHKAATLNTRRLRMQILNPTQAVPVRVVRTARVPASRNLFLGLAGSLAWVVGADKELSPVREREISGAGPG